jgi:hypothetical protein
MKRVLAIVAVVLAGCGPAGLLVPPVDIYVDGVAIGSTDPDLDLDPNRWHIALQESADYWGVMLEDLAGMQVGVSTTSIDSICGAPAYGCSWRPTIWILVVQPTCPERVLPHEIGHFLFGDPDHADPRFHHAGNVLGSELPGC